MAYNSSEQNCWALPFYGGYDASRVINLKIDGEDATPVIYGIWLIVSQDLKKIPTKVEYDFKTFEGMAPMHVVVNYDVVDYGISIDGTELTSLNMNNIPGLKSGKAYLDDSTGQGGSLGWGKTPTLVLDNATIETTNEKALHNSEGYDFTIKVKGDCSIINREEWGRVFDTEVATKTTLTAFGGGGTLNLVAVNDKGSADGIHFSDWAKLILTNNVNLIVDSETSHGICDDGFGSLEIQSGSTLCVHNVKSLWNTMYVPYSFTLGSGIDLRYPVGGSYKADDTVYYADGTVVKNDWVVFGPEGVVPPSESIAIAVGVSLPQALPEGEGAIYNLSGQRFDKMQRGVNIIHTSGSNRKVLVK